jgi:hypothetical protein
VNPAERTLRARLAAHTLHSTRDSRAITAPARAAFLNSFETKVLDAAAEAGERLSSAEVARRADHLKQAHFTRLALKSAASRSEKKRDPELTGSPRQSLAKGKDNVHSSDRTD